MMMKKFSTIYGQRLNVWWGRVAMLLVLLCVGCSNPAHTIYRSEIITYQFDEPLDYCSNFLHDTGFEMQCDEGVIEMRLMMHSDLLTLDDIEEAQSLNDINEVSQYIIAGNGREVTWFDLSTTTSVAPRYIAFLEMNRPDIYAIVLGFPNTGEEAEFMQIMRNLVVTLEP